MTWDTLLIDGVDTSNLFTVVEDFDGMEAAAGLRGSNYGIPGRDGEVWTAKSREPLEVTLGVALLAVDPETGEEPTTRDGKIAQLNANWLTLKRLVKPRRRQIELSRRLSLPGGTEYTIRAAAEHPDGLSVTRLGPTVFRTVLRFRIPYGAWYDSASSTFTVTAGTTSYVPVSGSTDTTLVAVHLTGGTGDQVFTNVSTGASFTYNWTEVDSSSRVEVDVERFSVIRIVPPATTGVISASRFSNLGDTRFMRLDPDVGAGVNEFTVSSGSATVFYNGTWL